MATSSSFLSWVFLFALAVPVRAPAQAPAAPLAADTPSASAAGTSFTAPRDWTLVRRDALTVLAAPEGDTRIVVADVKAADADAAVAAAWALYDPQAHWPLEMSSARPPRNGWDERHVYAYSTPATLARRVYAQALRHGQAWTVVIQDASSATEDKRNSQISLVFDRLSPPGHERETFAGRVAHPLDGERLQALKAFVQDAQRQLDIPGVGLGVVEDGKVLFSGGFGVRELGQPEAIDGDTLFLVASNTKALTTLMLARLVDAGRLDWDSPVAGLWPQFRLGDADTTAQVRVRHLLCACTGLPRQDMEWVFESEQATPESVMAVLGTMTPTSGFGELYQYSNYLAASGGFLGGHVLHPQLDIGAGYDAAMQAEVFDPLGMASTTFDQARALQGNHAMPHGFDIDGRTVRASMDANASVGAARPAGGAWSSVNDMLRYVRMELDLGRLPDGGTYLAQGPLLERRRMQVASGSDLAYGMGLEVDTSSGVPVVHHGGSLVGFKSDMFWLPEAGVGAVLLTNSERGRGLLVAFQRRLLELLYDGRPVAAQDVAARAQRFQEGMARDRKAMSVPAAADAAARLAAAYRNPALGEVRVAQRDGRLWFDVGGWQSEVGTRANDDGSVSFVTIDPAVNGWFEFVADGDARPAALVLQDAQHGYRFEPVL
ncbi:serine hydrolase domain-containing protein [Pseudoxanthomonas koreensis]|uniref:serine hydrolase domain-containing protein n=1 Tax=Pseudoxanthomonas koreensis TaxID=266061 RepID=UPI00139104D6|nr:serine hydrolase domain-containing protein [Pseudoxanthomonas koreensis]KAF1690624.1 serine hydrolase [Pseudoxanthomonas koreensis]